jgi:hypothetical protein
VTKLRADVRHVQSDVIDIKAEIREVKAEIRVTNQKIDKTNERINETDRTINGRLDEIKDSLASAKIWAVGLPVHALLLYVLARAFKWL